MKFSSVYPLYVAKVEKKGRTRDELHRVIEWLTGLDQRELVTHIEKESTSRSCSRPRGSIRASTSSPE